MTRSGAALYECVRKGGNTVCTICVRKGIVKYVCVRGIGRGMHCMYVCREEVEK